MQCICEPSGELGIALSGGGARAMAQLGVLKVLEREGIPVSYVSGTSGGAVIGAVHVTSANSREAEARVLEHLRSTGVGFNVATFAALAGRRSPGPAGLMALGRGLWRVATPRKGLIGGGAMRASFKTLLGERTFADTRLRFATAALDLTSGRRMIFAAGDLADAVYASSAIPGLFEPLELHGHVLVDGGWAEPVPVSTCHHLGAVHVVAVDVPDLPPTATHRRAVRVALRADALARGLLEELQLTQADFVLRPKVAVGHFADFSDPEGLIAAGERAAEAALGDIQAVLERHHSLFVRPAPAT